MYTHTHTHTRTHSLYRNTILRFSEQNSNAYQSKKQEYRVQVVEEGYRQNKGLFQAQTF